MSMMLNALSGAQAAQAALITNSQNIANAMTPGYTRQGVLLTALPGSKRGPMAAGSGVQVSALLRFADSYKSLQLWQSHAQLGQYKASQPYLTQLEQVMSDDTSNINQGLDAFFAALNAASVQPDSSPLREQVMTTADGLVKRFASVQQLLNNQQAALGEQRGAALQQVNGFAQDIALLNKQISAARAAGIQTAGLEDARDQKIDQLSALVGVQVLSQADGSRSVSLRSGQPLVLGGDAGRLGLNSGQLELNFVGTAFRVQAQSLGGQLGGLQDFEQQVLKPLQTSVSELAQGIAGRFNDQLAAGFAPPAPGPGKPLFVYAGGKLTLSTLTAKELAFASDPAASGDSGNLKALVALKNATVNLSVFDANGQPRLDAGGLPIIDAVVMGDVFTQLVGKLGVQSQQNTASLSTAQTVRDQSEESWKSSSGVNTDEEAINLMQYKQMYEANLKVVAVANELLDSTLAMIR